MQQKKEICYRLRKNELTSVLAETPHAGRQADGDDRRCEPRYRCNLTVSATLVMHCDGETIKGVASIRDLSSRGIGVRYQGRAVYKNTGCTVFLKNLQGDLTQLDGTVMYCRAVDSPTEQPGSQDVGIQFQVPVDVDAYITAEMLEPPPEPPPEPPSGSPSGSSPEAPSDPGTG